MEKYKQPDGLRGVLTLFVIWSHWLPFALGKGAAPILKQFLSEVGEAGIYFFFALSGFLITGILIKNRLAAEAEGYSKAKVWRSYFVRRALRIFPIYYLCLGFLFYYNTGWIREVGAWHVLYLSNILFYVQDSFGWGGHLWSLSSEEQFYLLWPVIMLFAPLRHLKKIVFALVLFAPLFRMCMNLYHPSTFTQLLTPAVFDGLGLGALLALQKYMPSARLQRLLASGYIRKGAFAALVVWLFFNFSPAHWGFFEEIRLPLTDLVRRSSLAVIGLFLVQGSVVGFTGPAKILLEHSIVQYLGKISYGLYLFHNFQLYLLDWFNIPLPTAGWYVWLHFGLLLIAASLSWYLVEEPANNLKKYFPYIKRRTGEPEPAAIAVSNAVQQDRQ